jgi:hypothetical protein
MSFFRTLWMSLTSLPAAPAAALRDGKPARDVRLDVFRGLALVFIFIDHVPGNWLEHATLRNFGFADAAELFVLVAGMSAALAYGKAFDNGRFRAAAWSPLKRAVTLYRWHVGTVALSVLILYGAAYHFENVVYFEHAGLWPFVRTPAEAIVHVFTLLNQPGYLNILPLYVALLAMFPALFWLVRRHWALGLGVSAAIWLAAYYGRINFPSTLDPWHGWFFNPLGWQFLFTIGLVLGDRMRRGLPAVPRTRWLTILAAGWAGFAFFLAAPWHHIPGLENARLFGVAWIGPMDKSYLSLWRVGQILALAYLVALLVPRTAPALNHGPAGFLALLGRHSLDIFCLLTVLSFLGMIALVEIGRGWEMQFAVNAAGIGLMAATAWGLEWYKKKQSTRVRIAGAAPAAAGAASQA